VKFRFFRLLHTFSRTAETTLLTLLSFRWQSPDVAFIAPESLWWHYSPHTVNVARHYQLRP